MSKNYIQQEVAEVELSSLVAVAKQEEENFYRRNPHLIEPYRSRLIAVALCQGAALQYIRRGYGVNDFDVHFFYAQNATKPRLARGVKSIWTSIGGFDEIRVDFIRTVIPLRVIDSDSPIDLIQSFLKVRPTSNAYYLAEKAVVGLLPRELFGHVLWPLDVE